MLVVVFKSGKSFELFKCC